MKNATLKTVENQLTNQECEKNTLLIQELISEENPSELAQSINELFYNYIEQSLSKNDDINLNSSNVYRIKRVVEFLNSLEIA